MNRLPYYPQAKQASFDSSSLTPVTTQLYEWDLPKAPQVYYTPLVWESIRYLVDTIATEVGWLGLVDIDDDGNYLVTEIFVPKQTVSGVETDITPEALVDLAVDLESKGISSEKLIYWGHSHVNMGVSPSMQDEVQVEEFLDNGCKYFIRGIYNKHGSSKVDVYDTAENCVHQCVRNGVQPTVLDDLLKTRLDDLIKTNVEKPVVKAFPKSKLGITHKTVVTNTAPNSYYLDGYGSYIDDDEYADDLERQEILSNPFGFREH